MLAFIPFDPRHVPLLAAAMPITTPIASPVPLDDAAAFAPMAVPGLSYSAYRDGELVAVGGLYPQWRGRAAAWSLAGALRRRDWPAITARTAAVLARGHGEGLHRIEAQAAAESPAAQRWLVRLGFRAEAVLERWRPDGGDVVQFRHFRED